MTNKIVIGLALANLQTNACAKEITDFIASNCENYDIYSLAPASPGSMRCAAFDFMLILKVTREVASVAELIWKAYDKFIAPKKASFKDDAGIYLGIRRPDGTVIDFWIGNKYKDKDIFIHEFTTKITAIQNEDDPNYWNQSAAEVEKSDVWVRIK